ncbi:MAG: MBL fold metallo-hydrolase [Bacteroidota bacterium]|jgi:hydroxyacylglutathione hydrolase
MYNVKAFTFNPLQENTYLIYNEAKNAIIIDPGCYYESEQQELYDFITNNGLNIKYLLNTHCHLDHVFGNKWVYENFHTPLHLHKSEIHVLQMAPASGLMWGIPFDNYQGAFVEINSGEHIQLDDDIIEILFTPGHSPGHLSFYSAQGGWVISGDVLFHESIGRTDLPGGNYNTLIKSIKDILWKLPEETIVYCGHGPATTINHEKKHNPFLI